MSDLLKDRKVVITGIGPLTSIGFGRDALWKSIIERKTGIRKVEFQVEGDIWDTFQAHKIDNFDITKFNIDKYILNDIKSWKKGKEDRELLYLMAAIRLALEDSRISYDREHNEVALFLTVEQPGFETFCNHVIEEAASFFKEHLRDDRVVSKIKMYKHLFFKLADEGYDLQTFMYLFLISKAFGFHGYSLFTSNACASGLYALESAARQIKYGESNVAIVAGCDYPFTMFKHLWFKERGLYAEDGKIKPFSREADGIVLGDGASALVLEELEYAQNRDAHIYAEYAGSGFSLEAWKVVLPDMGGNSYKKVISEALIRSSRQPEHIDLINPHGVGIKITDQYEARAIADIFGANENSVSAFKPYVGHNLGGSALIETIILLMAMQHNIIPSTMNSDEYDARYNINLVRELTRKNINTAMKLSCGFAGYNGAVVFEKNV